MTSIRNLKRPFTNYLSNRSALSIECIQIPTMHKLYAQRKAAFLIQLKFLSLYPPMLYILLQTKQPPRILIQKYVPAKNSNLHSCIYPPKKLFATHQRFLCNLYLYITFFGFSFFEHKLAFYFRQILKCQNNPCIILI